MSALKQTPLYAVQKAAGGRFIPFGEWQMPVQFAGTIVEHNAVRSAVGLFDVSHMGEVLVTGAEAESALNAIITNDLGRIGDGRALYTVMCRPNGGIVDDLIIYRERADRFFLCINASNREKDYAWICEHLRGDAHAEQQSDQWAQLALQGPAAVATLSLALGTDELREMKPFRFRDVHFEGQLLRVATTGYTGAGGYELYLPTATAPALWEALMKAGEPHGIQPAGLGARDTLRLEMGYCLYGNDIDESTTPLEAGLSWVTRLEKDHFVGRAALVSQKEEGVPRKLMGLELEGRGIARAGYPIVALDGTSIGQVTSGTHSPTLGRAIALGYVASAAAEPGNIVNIEIRGRAVPAKVARPPFVKN